MIKTPQTEDSAWALLADGLRKQAEERRRRLVAMPAALREHVRKYEALTGHSYDSGRVSEYEFIRMQRQEAGPCFVD